VTGRYAEYQTHHIVGASRLAELIDLLEGSDTCELKLTIPDSEIGTTSRSVGFDVLEAEIREVVFFDTPNLDLHRNRLVVRARRVQGGRGDTVVKVRPVIPSEIPPEIHQRKRVGVEVDVAPGGFVCSASMKGKTTATAIHGVILGNEPIKSLFSKKQRKVIKALGPEGVHLNDLAIMGPITILKLKSIPEGFSRKLVAEMWLYPDGSRILELSTKCLPGEALDVAAQWEGNLKKHGVGVAGKQKTKTAAALQYFSSLPTG
jgi:hypothetical protein